LESGDIATFKMNIEAFMRLYENAESMRGFMIRHCFYDAVKERDKVYRRRTQGLKYNAVIIPPELALTAMLPGYVKIDGNHNDFLDGLNRFRLSENKIFCLPTEVWRNKKTQSFCCVLI
jgi:hypothetical protein